MSTDNIPLLPCPWCQKRAVEYGSAYVGCPDNKCQGNGCVYTRERWNTRAPDPVREELVATLADVQWGNDDHCPWCDQKRRQGHTADCRIKLALQRTAP